MFAVISFSFRVPVDFLIIIIQLIYLYYVISLFNEVHYIISFIFRFNLLNFGSFIKIYNLHFALFYKTKN